MIYYINGEKFNQKENLQETYQDLVLYLNQISSIIVNNAGEPLDELDIKDLLKGNNNLIFETKLIIDHEQEVLLNVYQFSKELLLTIENLNLKSNEDILSAFSELSSTLLELSNVDSYFNLNKINKASIELTVRQAEEKIVENDYSSVVEIIELIYSEWIEDFIEELETRKGIIH
ncbi:MULTISPECIES: hypothetical protein [Paenibacillus]|uniref:hypothetical protein n=1 Tax=Paenibacillus TaxID=44249 RepID=UPI00096F6A48|nr:hypothetical protein [Paenibacillus odorifer]OMD62762.1 hypothetical protein BSK55_02130 [Paenibacillus odorifer]OMD81388.1 hypothetical protein BSK50_00550 [Paenibacillus odorifer]